MRVHACFLDAECTSITGDRIWRLNLSTTCGHLVIALHPRDRVQGWLPVLGALPHLGSWRCWTWLTWWYVTWHPRGRRPGLLVRRHPEWYGLRR